MKGYAPIVRPWLKAGLNVLLLEDEARVLELRAGPSQPAEESAEAARSAAPRPASAQLRRAAQPVPQRSQPPSQAAPRPAAKAAQPRIAPQTARSRGMQSLLGAPGALPVGRWPAAWLALKDRRPLPSRPLVLWTYAGLGEDLVGAPDEARRRVIVRMLTELRHPAGTHVFWPFSLAGEGLSPEASLFWSGVTLLDPRVILLFGSDTRDALGMPKSLLPFCQERAHGRLIVQLPRPQALAADESAFRQAQAFLARMLSFCAKR
ncbi:MAG: hypothetical protein IJD65_01600 [Mailhella sp.]|nr:hypothetical protein [Mailhella sp.]